MSTLEKSIETLNDLVQIHNDRIEGYERAIRETGDDNADLKTIFTEMIRESHQYKNELGTEIQASGEDMDTDTTTSGKIYRAWMDVKAAFTGHDRKSILANCEFGEDAAQKAYKSALDDDDLTANFRELVSRQQQQLKQSHDKIKALRDQA
ncbi:PA2169 family four-helix-bundle protein [Pedobacter sp. HMF7647]|uniref:PA2169 family four-helix-bundle protein n=1 Tax=Hufsiella arboris TaxID=2695275 RepID=A0A7K1YDB4_9SPHI|nr:PA2169 family four-helix-bundle protein [Hufsiella arboris]MXV52575.1 PA2169 family four-helix-bundle protein [Hufsiella arboris]